MKSKQHNMLLNCHIKGYLITRQDDTSFIYISSTYGILSGYHHCSNQVRDRNNSIKHVLI